MTRRTQETAKQDIVDIISSAEPKVKTRDIEIIEWKAAGSGTVLHVAVRIDDSTDTMSDNLLVGLENHNNQDCEHTTFLEAKRDWGKEGMDTIVLFFKASLNMKEEGEI